MDAYAIVIREPGRLACDRLALNDPGPADVVVDVDFSSISTGTERLMWSGAMPDFPGMGYPLVPGYEAAGRIIEAPKSSGLAGKFAFVPGANCFGAVRGLFGASAARLVVPAARVVPVSENLRERAVLLALAATAFHATANGAAQPELIVGHGVVGRLLARLAVLAGGQPVVWERHPLRRHGAELYTVCAPEDDLRRDYKTIFDASGDGEILDHLVQRLAPGGEIVLAGFYRRLGFAFAPAFMREAKIRIAAQWQPADLQAVVQLVDSGLLSLENLLTHRAAPAQAVSAYHTAFEDPECLKMLIDWSGT